jgi:hypothetical protein
MAESPAVRTVGVMTRSQPLILAATALVAAYLIGAAIAAATGVGSLAAAAGNGTKLSAPGFMIVAELLAVLAVARGRRAGAAVLVAVSAMSLVAATFDGDFAHASLSTGHVAWQGLEVALSLAVFALAAAALTRRPRRPAADAAA